MTSTPQDVLDGRARWSVTCADCLDVLPDVERADHVITDPPYEAQAHTKGRRGRRGGSFTETPLSFAAIDESTRLSVGAHIRRITKRWAIVFCQVEASQRWAAATDLATYVRTMVWIKDTTTPQMTGDRPGMGYESMVVSHPKGRKRWNGGGRSGVFRGASVARMGRANDHETQKPLSLLCELVELFTDPGDVILDAFAGSGTLGEAALGRGRRVILIERDQKWADFCVERMRAAERGTTANADRAGQISLLERVG